jgi:carboxylesterase
MEPMKMLSRINQSIWELQKKIDEDPGDIELRRELLKFVHESRLLMEKRAGVPDNERSTLLLQERESLCCLLLHGAGGSPEEMKPLAEHLFSKGYTVYSMHLPLYLKESDSGSKEQGKRSRRGEGVESAVKAARQNATWSVCLAESEVMLETLMSYSPSLYVIGFSFGGTIAINLMKKYAIKGTILLSPALFPQKTARYIWFKILSNLVPSLSKGMAPVKSTMLELMDRTRASLGAVDKPVLVIQAADDPVVSPKGFHLLKRRSKAPSSKFVMLRSGGHVILKGKQSSDIVTLCSDFIRNI